MELRCLLHICRLDRERVVPSTNSSSRPVALAFLLALPVLSACVHTQYFYAGTKRLDEVAVLVWDSSSEFGGHCFPAPTVLRSIDGNPPVQSRVILSRAELLPGKHTFVGVADYNLSLCDVDRKGLPLPLDSPQRRAPPPGTVDGFLAFSIDTTMEPGACYALRTEHLATELGELSWSPPFVRKIDANSVVGSLRMPESFYRWCARR